MGGNFLISKNKNAYIKYSMQVLGFVLILGIALWLATALQDAGAIKEIVAQYGYSGIFFVSILGGFNLVSSVPVVAFVPVFLVAGLSQWLIIFAIVAGVTVADMIAYGLGRAGKKIIPDSLERVVHRIEKLRERHHLIPLIALFFFAAFAPLPNEVLVIPMALMGYRLLHILPSVLLGNIVFNSLGAFGVINIFELL